MTTRGSGKVSASMMTGVSGVALQGLSPSDTLHDIGILEV